MMFGRRKEEYEVLERMAALIHTQTDLLKLLQELLSDDLRALGQKQDLILRLLAERGAAKTE